MQQVTPFNERLDWAFASGGWSVDGTRALAGLGREIGRQAAMIGYLDGFYFYMVTSLAVLPLVLLIRWQRG